MTDFIQDQVYKSKQVDSLKILSGGASFYSDKIAGCYSCACENDGNSKQFLQIFVLNPLTQPFKQL